SPELFRRTADGVRDGRVHIWPGKGHAATIGGSQSPSAFMALGFLLAEPAEGVGDHTEEAGGPADQ
ncbi:MAG TPA: hypothetical protein VF143_07115, partial [Candidatus Nanopelagicales bacterium]